MMKNCEPLVSGPELAMATMPRLYERDRFVLELVARAARTVTVRVAALMTNRVRGDESSDRRSSRLWPNRRN